MIDRIAAFSLEEHGAISLDWLVLTGVLVVTGVAVSNTVGEGVGIVGMNAAGQMRGQVVQYSFGPDNTCASGIEGLRAREAARLAAGGGDPVDVETWFGTHAARLSDTGLILERDRLAGEAASGDGWTRSDTLLGLVDCGMVQRGI